MSTTAKEHPFVRIADRVSYAVGTWQNIVVWLVLIGAWFAAGPYIAQHSFLPTWFTSNDFNFPLNTVTTIAELYIGFLVGASTNRTERNNREQSNRMEALERLIENELKDNGRMTADANAIAQEVKKQFPLVQEIHNYMQTVAANGETTRS
jgi:hypothetical protein